MYCTALRLAVYESGRSTNPGKAKDGTVAAMVRGARSGITHDAGRHVMTGGRAPSATRRG